MPFLSLVIKRDRVDLVEMTVNGVTTTEDSASADHLRQETQARFDRAFAEVGELRRQWEEKCSVTRETRARGMGTAIVDLVLTPDGEEEVLEGTGMTRIRDLARARFPDPERPSIIERRAPVVNWIAFSVDAAGSRQFETRGPTTWPHGFPVEWVLPMLDDIEARGWELVDVSEDRGLFAGTLGVNESHVVTARYLFQRQPRARIDLSKRLSPANGQGPS